MRREIIRTGDGSTTIYLPDLEENYHSRHGAIQEARHVFLRHGLDLFPDKSELCILEIGFGTGLNALLTAIENEGTGRIIRYTGVEAYPVEAAEASQMNYPEAVGHVLAASIFTDMHKAEWEVEVALTPSFYLTKRQQFFADIVDEAAFDLVYFDAFGFRVQPELWNEDIFRRMARALRPGGVLVTYAARTVIRRNMEVAGFSVEKLAGPPGKREMMRARRS
ncbi:MULTISPECIES: tRNA (5-methylaminomethyl-2-thiouridine)(34)-methyltransferase MnmD [unclassified Flavobacterium]|uniref:tRNA (5-methylaminomethyl-2-thiouridine)(34)-methyltransferase MnmD n=1 Tax=unclassified Flavobacterium TaxID=196869 RepID=UPI001F12D014|nr:MULTISPECIES: tRNA (5-methylaminomethyl-2-thiouridine)(34)-methyltransferase MnmD [unclassified Flavobacterium]UMY64859.1 tRNA (5-methylaminomethyl-2-thiouridine)(34)-methyltransferase MnmD [Flavobacterium sp. HJ-32-4]